MTHTACVASTGGADVSVLTSTSAAPGSLLKHMVMVFRAILKKLVKDTDFPCKETFNVNKLPKHTHTHTHDPGKLVTTLRELANKQMQQFVLAPKGSEVAAAKLSSSSAKAIRHNYSLNVHFVPLTEDVK